MKLPCLLWQSWKLGVALSIYLFPSSAVPEMYVVRSPYIASSSKSRISCARCAIKGGGVVQAVKHFAPCMILVFSEKSEISYQEPCKNDHYYHSRIILPIFTLLWCQVSLMKNVMQWNICKYMYIYDKINVTEYSCKKKARTNHNII